MNLTSLHEDVGLIPGLIHWVKGSGIAMSCGMYCGHGSDLALLWLGWRPVAVAPIQPLAWEPPYAAGVTLKEKKKKAFTGKGHLGGEQQGEGTQNCSATWLAVSCFVGMVLVSGLSLASRLAWLILGLAQDPPGGRCTSQSRWIPGPRLQGSWSSPPFWWPLLHSPGYPSGQHQLSLLGLPAVRQLMQAAIIVPGQSGWFWSMVH